MEPEAAAPAAAATTDMAIRAVVPAEFEIPAKISEMLAGNASGSTSSQISTTQWTSISNSM